MRKFLLENGRVAGETMTVSELRSKLSEYPDDMPVFGTWEGVSGYITPASFGIGKNHKGKKEEECDCLEIYVEDY